MSLIQQTPFPTLHDPTTFSQKAWGSCTTYTACSDRRLFGHSVLNGFNKLRFDRLTASGRLFGHLRYFMKTFSGLLIT